MSAPIKHEDIRKGDRVRMVHEYTAGGSPDGTSLAYELIERPVQLPTEPGIYLDREGDTWSLSAETEDREQHWRCGNDFMTDHPDALKYAPFTLLRPVAEVAAEVLAEVLAEFEKPDNACNTWADDVRAVAAKWATK